jgi:hypothetical protein
VGKIWGQWEKIVKTAMRWENRINKNSVNGTIQVTIFEIVG